MSVRHAILGLLAQRPRHGYELRLGFEALAGGEQLWEVKPAQIYSTLARLAEGGLVQQEGVEQGGGPEKRIYSITPAGKATTACGMTKRIAIVPVSQPESAPYLLRIAPTSPATVAPYRIAASMRARNISLMGRVLRSRISSTLASRTASQVGKRSRNRS